MPRIEIGKPRIKIGEPKGVLRRGWSNTVDDYAIAGGWVQRGEVLVVADAAGGVHAFDATSGQAALGASGHP